MLAIKRDLPRPSRRQFLVGAAAAGAGLTIGFHVPMGLASRALAADTVNPINAYLRIGPDGTVTVLSAHMDGGQGIYTGVATLVAEELDADWSQVRVEGAAGNPKLYGNLTWGGAVQGTGGSSSVPSSWERYRHAGAIARAMLVEAAAQEWGVPAGEVQVARGVISHASGKSAGFGELADRAAGVTPRAEVKLKDPSAWVHIGNEKLRRLELGRQDDGRAAVPDRRPAAGHVDGGARAPAAVRSKGELVRRGCRHADQGRGGRGRDAARRRRGRKGHVVGDQGSRRAARRLGRIGRRDAQLG